MSQSGLPAARQVFRPARTAFVLLAIGLTLGWVAQQVAWEGVRLALEDFHPSVLAMLSLNYVAVLWMRSRRAQLLLPEGPALRELVPVIAVSFVAAAIVPMRLGAVVRPWLLQRHLGVPFGVGVAGALAERLIDLVVLLLLIALVLAFAPPPVVLDALTGTRDLLLVACVLALLGFGVVAWLGPDAVRARLGPVSAGGGVRSRLVEAAAGFATGVQSMRGSTARSAEALGWTLGLWLAGFFGVWVVMSGFPEMRSEPGMIVAFWCSAMLAAAAVPTPGSVGAFEAAGIAALTAYGVPADQAGAFTFVLHLGMFTTNLMLAGVALLRGLPPPRSEQAG